MTISNIKFILWNKGRCNKQEMNFISNKNVAPQKLNHFLFLQGGKIIEFFSQKVIKSLVSGHMNSISN